MIPIPLDDHEFKGLDTWADAFKANRLLRLEDGVLRTIPLDDYKFRGLITWADVHGITPHAVFGRVNGFLEYWDLGAMSRVASWRAHEGEVTTVAFSPDGQLIATTGEKCDVKLWRATTQREVRPLDPSGEKMGFLTFSPDGRLLAGSGWGSGGNWFASQRFTPDGRLLAGSGGSVCVWDVNSGHLLPGLNIPDHELVPSLAFSNDRKLLATASFNNTAQLWDLPSGSLRGTLQGHVQAVMGVAFSPDNKTLATAGEDGKVKLWNIDTLQEMVTLEPVRGGCRQAMFSPDGRTLAVSSFSDPEPYIWLWEVPSFEEIDAAEAGRQNKSQQP
jgi:WD40 repeat protein